MRLPPAPAGEEPPGDGLARPAGQAVEIAADQVDRHHARRLPLDPVDDEPERTWANDATMAR
jgi:hypothetical protein